MAAFSPAGSLPGSGRVLRCVGGGWSGEVWRNIAAPDVSAAQLSSSPASSTALMSPPHRRTVNHTGAGGERVTSQGGHKTFPLSQTLFTVGQLTLQ